MAIISEGLQLLNGVVTMFTPKEPTPEEQKKKAGVWYRMLQYFVENDPTPEKFKSLFLNQLPFAQKSTKTRFWENNITGKSRSFIVDSLVGKINDEMIKGGFDSLTKDAILTGMGSNDFSAQSSNSVIDTGARTISPLDSASSATPGGNNTVFLVLIGVLGLVGILFFTNKKPKRRR